MPGKDELEQASRSNEWAAMLLGQIGKTITEEEALNEWAKYKYKHDVQ